MTTERRFQGRRTALPDAARLGTLELGCFRLKEVLGRGSYGTVFLADQEGFAREAVVKIAHAKLVDGRDGDMVRRRFGAELKAATRVNHPNVVTLYTAGETNDGLPAIAMEYVPGAPLEDILDRRAGDLPAPFIHSIFAQLGAAVAAFHRASVTHRDLSPGNVVVSDADDGSVVVKVLDFGVAQMGEDSGRSSVVGTPRYMAPEQVVGAAGPASDIYAVGAMLWWALTGEEYSSEVRTLQDVTEARLMGARPADIRAVDPEIPIDVAVLIQDMLAFEPKERPTASEFCDRWDTCRENLDTVNPSTKRRVTIPPTRGVTFDSLKMKTSRPDALECVAIETDHVRAGVLQGFLTLHRCNTRCVDAHEAVAAFALRPEVIFISGELPGGASGPMIARARADVPGGLVVAMISSERQRTAMIRAGADYALRVPDDMPHLIEYLEEVRRHSRQTVPATTSSELTKLAPTPAQTRTQPTPEMIDNFMGEAPELIADISDAIARQQGSEARRACELLRHRALSLDSADLARLASACAAFADEGDFTTAADFMDELENAYTDVFRSLMNIRTPTAFERVE